MEKIKLGDLCKPSAGQIKEDEDTLIDYIDISSVDNETKKVTGYQTITFGEAPSRARKAVRRGNVLVSTVRPNLNAVALLEEDTPNVSVASTGFCVLESKDDVDPRFILNFCKSKPFIDDMVSQATGASYPAVSDKIVRSALVPKYSYQEQQHISTVLDKLAGIIDDRRIELQQLDDLIKARFVEMFGNPVNNSKGLPEATLPELGEFGRGVSKHRPRNDPKLLGGEYPLIQTGDVAAAELYITDYSSTYSELGLQQSKMWKKGTLCITIAANIAKTAILTFDACFPDSVVGFMANDRTSNIFIHYWFSFFQAILESQAPESAQKNINLKILSDLKVINPSKEDQEEFVQFVEQVDKSKVVVQKALDEAQLLFDSLMQEYFG